MSLIIISWLNYLSDPETLYSPANMQMKFLFVKTGLCVNVVHSLITLQHSSQGGPSIVNTQPGKCCCCCCSVTRTALLMTITEESGCCFSSIRGRRTQFLSIKCGYSINYFPVAQHYSIMHKYAFILRRWYRRPIGSDQLLKISSIHHLLCVSLWWMGNKGNKITTHMMVDGFSICSYRAMALWKRHVTSSSKWSDFLITIIDETLSSHSLFYYISFFFR